MARFRVVGNLLTTGQAVIVKVTADNEFAAIAQAAKDIADSGQVLTAIHRLRVRKLDSSTKSSVYIGKVPTGSSKRGKKPTPAAAAATTPAATVSAPETAPTPATVSAPAAAAAAATSGKGNKGK